MGCVQKNSKQLPQTQCSTQTILINSVPIELVGKVENDKLIKNKLRAASNSHLYEKALENENATNIEQRRQQWRSKITSISNNNSISVANSGSKNPLFYITKYPYQKELKNLYRFSRKHSMTYYIPIFYIKHKIKAYSISRITFLVYFYFRQFIEVQQNLYCLFLFQLCRYALGKCLKISDISEISMNLIELTENVMKIFLNFNLLYPNHQFLMNPSSEPTKTNFIH
ncbi:hypothetical protein pb186bvf_021052 [Paramecium bursaria]